MKEIVFLLVITLTDGSSPERVTYHMPTWEKCLETLKQSKIENCEKGDCENSIALTCVGGR